MRAPTQQRDVSRAYGWWLHLAAGCLLLGCGPSASATRVGDDGAVAADSAGSGGSSPATGGASGVGGSIGGSGASGAGGAGGAGGAAGAGGATPGAAGAGGAGTGGAGGGAKVDVQPEPDLGADEPVALPPDLVAARRALLVVGDPQMLTAGDMKIRSVLEARGFAVTVGDDDGNASDASGRDLVVLSSTSVSATLAAKFKDINLPVIDMEASVFDDMKMTGPTSKTDFDEEDDRRITILSGTPNPLAAGLTGTVTVSSGGGTECCGINWGKPASSALTIASHGGSMNSRITIFAYDKGNKMVDDFTAPARRLGFFTADTTLAHLTADGLKLLNAAISWAAP